MRSKIQFINKKMKDELAVIAQRIIRARSLITETSDRAPFLEQMDRDYYYLKKLSEPNSLKIKPVRLKQLDLFE